MGNSEAESGFTEEMAQQALVIACERAGLDPAGSELIRIGSNAVYRLRESVIVRIARDAGEAGNARKQVAVARWLESQGYPATRVLEVEQPIIVDQRPVTFWESASEKEEFAAIDQVAQVIRRLHELDAPVDLELPEKQPFGDIMSRLANLDAIDPADAQFLRERVGELQERYARLNFALQPGVIHGDANVGNVIKDRYGEPLLIDLDSFCVGPREWDLVQTALFYERFGWHTEDEYRRFVDVYGFDIMTWPGYPVLADYREVAMTLWLSGKARTEQRSADEVHKRVETMRTNGDRGSWAPF